VIVALANKLAQIAWAVLARDRQYATVQANGNGGSEDIEANGPTTSASRSDGLTVDRPGNLIS